MEFEDAFGKVADILAKTGSMINESAYDGLIVKRLESSNTLDEGRTTNQTHIAITGSQMDMFPYVRADGYFEVEYEREDNILKKYFVAQIPAYLHKENVTYLNSDTHIFSENEKLVHISIVRSRRRGAADQIQMSMTNMDSPEYVKYRKLVHAKYFMIMLKRKERLIYDIYCINPMVDLDDAESVLASMNNGFFKRRTSTLVKIDELIADEADDEVATVSLSTKECNKPHNRIISGAPGTGKSYKFETEKEEFFSEAQYERVTFHPAYSYAHFFGCYKPVNTDNGIEYKFVPGPFVRIWLRAMADPEHNYLLLIEEINRAEVAGVFGDVFQLLDRNKDGRSQYPIDMSEDLKRYVESGEWKDIVLAGDVEIDTTQKMFIPANMYIWATMNSADQGVYPMDTAFKRRWNFEYMPLNGRDALNELDDYEIVREFEDAGPEYKVQIFTWNTVRVAINDFLSSEKMKVNEDKLMGPFFLSRDIVGKGAIKADKDKNFNNFIVAFKNKVLMYLFDDAGKAKRPELFREVSEYNRFSAILEKFDKKGMRIFNDQIRDKIKYSTPNDVMVAAENVNMDTINQTPQAPYTSSPAPAEGINS